MAPEQIMHSQEPDRRSDIYGLGAVAYFMLTGQPPFRGENPMEVMMAHVRDTVIPPSQLRAEIPADLERVVLRCLAKNPHDRFQDTPSLALELERCADSVNWSPKHAARWWQDHQGQTLEKPLGKPPLERNPPATKTTLATDGQTKASADRFM
jgi:serine/threonine-protein kinase